MIRTCRFCKDYVSDTFMPGLKYSARCYAHYDCYLSKRGLKGLNGWQIDRIPPPLLTRYGLFAEACRIIDAWKTKELSQ